MNLTLEDEEARGERPAPCAKDGFDGGDEGATFHRNGFVGSNGAGGLYDDDHGGEALDTSDNSSADEQITCLSLSDGDESSDQARRANLFRQVLDALGENVERQGIVKTPARYAKALAQMLSGYQKTAEQVLGDAIFHEDTMYNRNNQFVCVKSIDFYSTDAHTLLPFFGEVSICYLPAHGKVAGLSKFARITEVFSKRLQTPARLAAAIASAIETLLAPLGVLVLIRYTSLGHGGENAAVVEARGGLGTEHKTQEAEEMLALMDFERFGGALGLARKLRSEGEGGASGSGASLAAAAMASQSDAPPAPSSSSLEVSGCYTGILDSVLTLDDTQRETTIKNLIYQIHSQDRHWERSRGAIMAPMAEEGSGFLTQELLWNASASYSNWLLMMTSGGFFSTEYVLQVVRSLRKHKQAPLLGQAGYSAPPQRSGGAHGEGGGEGKGGDVEVFASVGSICEHHILPFFGRVYISVSWNDNTPGAQVTREELQGIIWKFSRQLQLQERLGTQIADAIEKHFPFCEGVFLCMSSFHHCMRARGAEKTSAKTLTVIKRGIYSEDREKSAQCIRRFHALSWTSGGSPGNGGSAKGFLI